MHATLAYLNAAGRRATRLTRSSCAFIQVMDALLAGPHSGHSARHASALGRRSISFEAATNIHARVQCQNVRQASHSDGPSR